MRLCVLGAGAVGSAVVELAAEHGHVVTAFADSDSAVVDADGIDADAVLSKKREDGVVGDADPESVFDADYDVLVEATPTTLGDAEPGFSHVERALADDCHVVLANKGPVAERYADVRALEADSEGTVRFGATVGGALPILSTIEDVGPSRVSAVYGVLNGTANFVLSRMAAEGLDYEHVLAEAQDLGVAEADPAFDVDGTDTALKGVIVANVLAEGETEFTLGDAEVEGIQELSGGMLDLAQEDGQTIRLIVEVADGSVRVGPRLVSANGAVAPSGTENAVQIEADYCGRLGITGRGAGGPETASAVLTDVERLAD
ncbi:MULTISPECIES: homoserine dehydrogenase [unclassified Haloferax]|uniref:Homoserine dehydrogenase n=1 Tax=Haloferax sp. Atlit-48N TaxID=2077198 RepID=A0ACD5HXW7_9EURY|nr:MULTISPECIES: homoserine dehydrogenase [unclassified Haloferax]MBC9985398.1 homoserine dehydrogenase [Haloferax sp. AS1]RDZ33210.1 homoserine dehydrogenase [Haloferax sp. Atlit-48N]RDZ37098.1 homoserine dehydrogenase [Haloferax sp. Atlit-24N]RDZ41396.1 homoserine dehydrogenase [Haloferax sp. Atlit-47N]RLM37895.1 homoserine dehydrogenase [Haloferax sp. Atlit-109R]